MDAISGAVQNVERVVQRLEGVPSILEARMSRVLARCGLELQGIVKDEFLSGQVLKVRTGWLKSSITTQQETTGEAIEQTVGIHMPRPSTVPKGGHPRIYGAAHEYGFSGVVTMRSALKGIRPRNARGHFTPFPTRTLNIPERSFLRAALAAYAPTFEAEVGKELAAATAEMSDA